MWAIDRGAAPDKGENLQNPVPRIPPARREKLIKTSHQATIFMMKTRPIGTNGDALPTGNSSYFGGRLVDAELYAVGC